MRSYNLRHYGPVCHSVAYRPLGNKLSVVEVIDDTGMDVTATLKTVCETFSRADL